MRNGAGAFFLYRDAADVDIDAVKATFSRRGFGAPTELRIGRLRLLIYGKVLVGNIVSPDNATNYGSIVIGNDCPVMSTSYCKMDLGVDRVGITLDESGLGQLYHDCENDTLSDSLLAIINARTGRRRIDGIGCLANLVLGYNLPGESVFSGVQRYSGVIVEVEERGVSHTKRKSAEIVEERSGNRDDAIKRLNRVLSDYMNAVGDELGGTPADIGISGGYDSRLLAALALKAGINMRLHTHYKGEQDGDFRTAVELAQRVGKEVVFKQYKPPWRMDDSYLRETVEESLLYFDGRLYRGISLFKREYSLEYKRFAAEGSGISLSGFGGELFRNHLNLPRAGMRLNEFIQHYLVGTAAAYSVERDAYELLRKRLLEAVVNVGVEVGEGSERVGGRGLKRILADVWVPNYHGIRNSIENQVGRYFSPFAEKRIRDIAVAESGWMGYGGEFEARMIRELNPNLAGLNSVYGHSFARYPIARRIKDRARALGTVRAATRKTRIRRRMLDSRWRHYKGLIESHQILREAYETLTELELPVKWETYITNEDRFNHALSLGAMLNQLSSRVEITAAW